MANNNTFGVLDGLTEEAVSEVLAPNTVDKSNKSGAKDSSSAKPQRAPRTTPVFNVDQTVKRLEGSPPRTNDLEVPYPPVRVASASEAKKASSMRSGGSFGMKDGIAKLAYGSYADGDLQI